MALKKHGVASAMQPHAIIWRILVHPKDKIEMEEHREVVYRIPCKNCEGVYIGETGRLLKTRMEEHIKDLDNSDPASQYTRSARKVFQSYMNKSATSDHASRDNHIIDWEGVCVVDKEGHK